MTRCGLVAVFENALKPLKNSTEWRLSDQVRFLGPILCKNDSLTASEKG